MSREAEPNEPDDRIFKRSLPRSRPDEDENAKGKKTNTTTKGPQNMVEHNDGLRQTYAVLARR